MSTFAYAWVPPHTPSVIQPSDFPTAIDHFYVDQCSFTDERVERQRLLQTCAQQTPDAVQVRQIGELGRTLAEVVTAIQSLEAVGVKVTALDGSYITVVPRTEILPDELLHLAETTQAQHRSQQLRAGHARNRVNVLPPPGRAPYGYRRGQTRYALDRAAAPVVKDFFDHFILYGSIRGAAKFLAKQYGKRISPSTAQRWLQHPVYRGDSQYQDGSVIRDTHTPIISREEAAQVDRLLRRNRKLPPKSASAQRSLAGLVQCAECQSKLQISRVTRPRQTQEYLYLRPQHCGREQRCRAIAYDAVLTQTIDAICVQFPDTVANLDAPPIAAIRSQLTNQIQAQQATLEQIHQLEQQGILDAASANLRRYTLRSHLSDLQQQLSQLPPENLTKLASTLGSQAFWQDLSETERRVYLREFIRTVWIERQGTDWSVAIQFMG